jgi:heptosyltransferase III
VSLIKKGERCAIFSCKGLGDGLIALVLSNNLQQNDVQTTTFHPFLQGLQSWFPHLEMTSFPQIADIPACLESYDRFFIVYEKSPWMQAILTECLARFRSKTTVINPIATPNKDYPFWEEARFDGTRSFVDNLFQFSQNRLKLSKTTRENGILPPASLQANRYPNRIVIHPTSSRPGKNWDQVKYMQLAQALEKRGIEPAFLLTEEEKKEWPKQIHAPDWKSLTDLASYVYQSGMMVGNDSGIGHLASCLGLPTLILCRSPMAANFWRPSWSKGHVITPSPWIPNLKGLRWRDKHWQKWISVSKVLSYCQKLTSSL